MLSCQKTKTTSLKLHYEVITAFSNNCFSLSIFNEQTFFSPYHFHPQYELTLISKGMGTRFVGNNMAEYAEGDLVLLGKNLPHCWKSTREVNDEINASVFHFEEHFLGADLLRKDELTNIRQLLNDSIYGIKFTEDTAQEVKKSMINIIENESPFEKLLLFLTILQKLALYNYILLDKSVLSGITNSEVDLGRINPVLSYIIENFRNEVSLDEAAHTANMSATAFCKYFKKMTNKTFIETVNEYRVSNAMMLLIQSDKPVNHICYDSGFTDVSHFYRTFKRKTGHSPLGYRMKFFRRASL